LRRRRLARSRAARAFLDRADWAGARRLLLKGDASTRAYERVIGDGRAAILMNAPARPEGPPVWEGRAYDDVAHRARDVRPFLAVGAALRAAGFRAPETYAGDAEAGFLLLEDLGSEGIVSPDGRPILPRYEAAIDVLAALHARPGPAALPTGDGGSYAVPPYDREALLIEVSLYADWHARLGPAARARFLGDWRALLSTLAETEPALVLRDLHSPNILWQEGAAGHARVGLLDYQDALLGHPAYDVASLAQDARVEIGEGEERALVARYVAARRGADPGFDEAGFARAYRILALQRATKVLGAFSRLAAQENKPGYQVHIGHVRELVARNLADPVLRPVALWYQQPPVG